MRDIEPGAPIPATGTYTYTATVRDFYGTGTSEYAVTAQRLNNPAGCGTLVHGGVVAGSMAHDPDDSAENSVHETFLSCGECGPQAQAGFPPEPERWRAAMDVHGSIPQVTTAVA